ncbi:MAG: PaaI family thioesterase [Dichotomicrobium sp.]
MTVAEIDAFLDREFAEIRRAAPTLKVETVGHAFARLRLGYDPQSLRPGGTISGPAMFTLADVAMYVAVLTSIGPAALAVTTNLNINFLRRPPPGDLLGEAHLLKLGKSLAYGEIHLRADGQQECVAHAVGTYALPPDHLW